MEQNPNSSNSREPTLIDYNYPERAEIDFGLDGQSYSIRLTPGKATDLYRKLAPFIEAGRLVRDECDDPEGFRLRLAPFIEMARLARLERTRPARLERPEP